jgi:hypothetical protein
LRPQYEARAKDTEYESEFEPLDETWDFFKKGCVFDLLSGYAPGQVNFEEVAEQGLGKVNGDSAEEDIEEEKPF